MEDLNQENLNQDQSTPNETVETQTPDTDAQEVKTYTEAEYKEAVEKAVKETSTTLKREYSKTLGVNLFDENETKSFIEGLTNKVDAKELETYKSQLQELDTLRQEKEALTLDNLIIKNGIKEEYHDKVKKLVSVEKQGEVTYEEAVNKVIAEFPMFKGTRQAGMAFNDDNSTLTPHEQYLKDNYVMENGKPIRRK
jgi:hypothetical protein